MKLLVTGCNGQLGNEIISIIKKGKSEIGEIPQEVKNAEITAIDIDTLDISDYEAVSSFVANDNPDVIINCAAMTNVDGCESMQDIAFKANALGVRNLAMAAENIGAKFVQISTDYVFEGNATKPYIEWDTVHPVSAYGASKALGEKYALRFCSKTFVIRTSWLYGYVGKNFVKTVKTVLAQKGEMKVVNDQRGNPTNANDLAHHILKLIPTNEYGIFHCTGEGECTWYEFACKIAELSGFAGKVKPCTSEEFPSPTKRPKYSSLRNLALECTVGNEMRDWQTAITEYIKNTEEK